MVLNKKSKRLGRGGDVHIYISKNNFTDIAIIQIQKASTIRKERYMNCCKDHAVSYSE